MSESDDWTAERSAEFRKARAIPGVGIGPLEVMPPEEYVGYVRAVSVQGLAPMPARLTATIDAAECFYPDEPFSIPLSDQVRVAIQRMSAARFEPEPARYHPIQIHWERWTISLFGVEYSLELFAALAGCDLAMYKGPGASAAARGSIATTHIEVAARPDDGVVTLRRFLPPTPV